MRKIVLAALSAIFVCFNIEARKLTPEEALGRMQTISASKGMTAPSAAAYQLAYSSMKNGNATYYAFNKAGGAGFVILSADDCMPAVLMESDGNATFDAADMPDGMKYWLSLYEAAISKYAAEGTTYTTALTSYAEISPLLETNGKRTAWSQGSPYNDLCPTYGSTSIHGLTGCVATAMAQIMRFHEYPVKGKGSKTYEYEFEYITDTDNETVKQTASTDFSAHTYDWASMIDNYSSGGYSPTQGTAVAQLMYDCGVAANMQYGNEGSGTAELYAAAGLVDHFDYDASLVNLPREIFTDAQWEERIYDELSQGRPVLYTGNDINNNGGHAFVCDGYLDGRYHMNWGWGGGRNCYVLMVPSSTEEAIAPKQENTFQTKYSFSDSQTAIVNIKPNEGGKMSDEVKMVCLGSYATESYSSSAGLIECSSFNRTDRLYIKGSFYNYCYSTRNYAFGIKASNDTKTYCMSASSDTLDPYYGYSAFGTLLVDILEPGTYTITPIYKDLSAGDTEWKEMAMRSDIVKPTITIKEFTSYNKPYMQITEMPVISTNGGTTTTEDNQVLKTNGKVDLNISLKAKILNSINPTYRYNGAYTSDTHQLLAYIYDYETGTLKTILYCDCGKQTVGTTATFPVTSYFTDMVPSDSLMVGHEYVIEFDDVYRVYNSRINYTSKTLPDYNMQTLPGSEYQDVVFKVVDKITTFEKSDVNRDGYTNSVDINSVLNVMTGDNANPRADVNGDGYVNSVDINAILNVMTGSK